MSRRTKRRWQFGALAFITLLLVLLAWPREDIILSKLGVEPLKVRRGLDLQGGVYLVYEAQLNQLPADNDTNSDEVLSNARSVIENRVNPGGTSEATVRTAGGNRIVVELPAVDDPESAKELIGQTAQLAFYEVQQGEEGQGLVPTDVSGSDIKRATPDFQQTGGQPIVNLEFKGGESTDKFADLTTRLSQSGNTLVVFLDQQVVFGPATVQQPITDGRSQLSGQFNVQEAKQIVTLLNAGALPVPVALVAQQSIGPTLGAESIKQSVLAATIGLLSVAVFLVLYYRLAGVAALASLAFYSLLLLDTFKLSGLTSYPLVLTLAGIAGFILSIAVAVDTNILIFERVKEELKRGTVAPIAFEDGFNHAWSSIRDANVATLISTVILYIFGAGTPAIRGFAVTLGIGVIINLITAQTVTKLLMRWLVASKLTAKRHWIGLNMGPRDGVQS